VYEEEIRDHVIETALSTGSSGFDTYFIAIAKLYNATLITDDEPMSIRTDIDRVIDIGCADGEYLGMLSSQLNPSLIIGLDLSKDELLLAKPHTIHPNIDLILADAHYPPFRGGVFDLVFLKDLLHHLDNPLKALHEFKRILRAGSVMVIIETRRNPLMKIYIKYGHDHFSLKHLLSMIEKAGLKDYKIKQLTAYPHHLFFPFRGLGEVLWDLSMLILYVLCRISFFKVLLFKLYFHILPPSYNVIFWGKEY